MIKRARGERLGAQAGIDTIDIDVEIKNLGSDARHIKISGDLAITDSSDLEHKIAAALGLRKEQPEVGILETDGDGSYVDDNQGYRRFVIDFSEASFSKAENDQASILPFALILAMIQFKYKNAEDNVEAQKNVKFVRSSNEKVNELLERHVTYGEFETYGHHRRAEIAFDLDTIYNLLNIIVSDRRSGHDRRTGQVTSREILEKRGRPDRRTPKQDGQYKGRYVSLDKESQVRKPKEDPLKEVESEFIFMSADNRPAIKDLYLEITSPDPQTRIRRLRYIATKYVEGELDYKKRALYRKIHILLEWKMHDPDAEVSRYAAALLRLADPQISTRKEEIDNIARRLTSTMADKHRVDYLGLLEWKRQSDPSERIKAYATRKLTELIEE